MSESRDASRTSYAVLGVVALVGSILLFIFLPSDNPGLGDPPGWVLGSAALVLAIYCAFKVLRRR